MSFNFRRNVDSKLVASAVSHKLVDPTVQINPPSQRSFCIGRQRCSIVVDLDVYMCVFDNRSDANFSSGGIGEFPATASYDSCNAPIALHE